MSDFDYAVDFATIAASLHAAPTPTETADDIVGYVRQQLDADHGSITVIGSRNRLETIASTDRLAEQLDKEQYKLREGPCYDSSWHAQTLTSSSVADDERWPRWAARANALGVVSLLAVELTTVDDQRLGSINSYWTRPRDITPDDAAFMSIFARHAALALAQAWDEDGLNVALDGRKLIGQAQGILMERYDLDEARAFEVLRRYSQDHNIKLRDVAAYLMATRQLPILGDLQP
jgi:GAF domain-containing protein